MLAVAGCSQLSESQKLIDEARAATGNLVRDPSSSQFRNETAYLDSQVVCGEFNSKNAYGAFAGYQVYVFESGSVTIEGEPAFSSAKTKCKGAGAAALALDKSYQDRLIQSLKQ